MMKGKVGVIIIKPPRHLSPNIGKHMIIFVTILITTTGSKNCTCIVYFFIRSIFVAGQADNFNSENFRNYGSIPFYIMVIIGFLL